MVEIKKIFDAKELTEEKDSCKLAKEFSEKIGEYPNTSTFIAIEDAINTGSDISLIEDGDNSESDIQRDFITQ
jgi:hypothetical protein